MKKVQFGIIMRYYYSYWIDVTSSCYFGIQDELSLLPFKIAEDANAVMLILMFAAGKEILCYKKTKQSLMNSH